MTLKIALVALALALGWLFLRSVPGTRQGRSGSSPPAPPATALSRCPECGVYRLPGASCDCDPTPSPRE